MVQAKRGLNPTAPGPRTERRPLPPQSSIDEEFTAFFNTTYQPLLAFATWWCRSPHDADEAVAIVMAYVYEHWTTIRNPQKYARRAVVNSIQKMRRDRGDGRCFPVPSDQLPEGVDETPEFDRLEGEEWANELLAKLSPRQYAVLSRYLDGLSMKEISDKLRKSGPTVRQNLKHARDKLLPHVKEYDRRKPCPSDKQETREETR
ncbi:hypothetical protein GCM10022225_51120 [Plantactinospora mayteni]|uniref:RNA polymerase sigma factor 70 region 4 type 2 domain-containing protein n=1 Tax=Plantactinospora mayteni TaxID=566021 RepID=A0ABQ4F475_9ACTN|nr:sigma-70 family RNA polymerase sigma factor [Plantactinospora mayteni]GIH01709.1 hypothetical protein Pma05_82810 [Plantactinospora mayteni]